MYDVPVKEVTDEHLGQWISTDPFLTPTQFSVAIVDLAIKNGFEIEQDVWNEDHEIFVNGDATFEMLEDLGFVTDTALEYLNDQLPRGFFFDFDQGLSLYYDEETHFHNHPHGHPHDAQHPEGEHDLTLNE